MYVIVFYAMVYLGSALMVYNIYRFARFTRYVIDHVDLEKEYFITIVPTTLLVCFLLGYLGVSIFGEPSVLVGAILFGGSIFVYLASVLLQRVTERVVEHERKNADLMAAERANEAKSSFLASVSHEMRTPMNVIIGTCDMILREGDLTEFEREHLINVSLAARHLADLINNVLDLNESAGGSLTVKSEPFSASEALNEVRAITAMLADQKGLDFVSVTQGQLAASCLGDELRVRQAILCILDNAVKYTDAPGTVTLTVTAEPVADERQRVTVTVEDTGVGMDEAFIPTIFQPFSQEDASFTSRFGGQGLSLAVTKRYLDVMGATIHAESRKGEGSTFTVTFTFPVVEEAVEEEAVEVSLEGRRVLVVEDIDENAEIVCDLLELEGIESERAENGQVAVDMFSAAPLNHFDAVLMDLRMPVMDGFEATRQIRALPREDASLPIIALTANTSTEDRAHTAEVGMDAHLAKPTDVDQLFETIRTLIAPVPAA